MNRVYLNVRAKSIFSRTNITEMLSILFVLFLTVSASEQPCEDVESVDITNGTISRSGSVQYGDDVFPPKYVYSKNMDGVMRTFGCMCKLKNCFRKCCPLGSVFYNRSCTEFTDLDGIVNNGLNLYEGTTFRANKSLEEAGFGLLLGKPSTGCYVEDIGSWFIQENGSLLVQIDKINAQTYGPDKYCIDNFVLYDPESNTSTTELNALICFVTSEPENHYALSSSCMLISCFFIILTVAVYAWLPELRNLHGMVLMAYLLSFFVGFVFLAAMQILLLWNHITQEMCTAFTFIIYFSLLAAFFWMNVMCYDIWWTFSGKRAMSGRKSSVRRRFLHYSLYAFSVPTALTILLAVLEFSIVPETSTLLPRIRKQGCFIYGQSKLLYLYVPIVCLCVANLVFFTLTALKIAEIKKQTQVLNKKDEQRFTLYIKLFIVMGVNWILEVISSFYPKADYIWRFTDAYNVLVGLIIFIIFVCKKKTLVMIKQRYRNITGRTLSRTQTTSTSISTRTFSKDEMQMNSASFKK